ncbi:MAG TPA: M14 family zinc carboxypeptidase, partial [bacterium]|nr:M14 family zinc carboxypeptidase [bacterium]
MRGLAALLFLYTAVVLAVAIPARAEPLRHVRIEAQDAPSLAVELLRSGFDVLEGETGPGTVDVIVTAEDLELLRDRGLQPELIATGRPYRDIQQEALGAAVPTGYLDLAAVLTRMQAVADSFPSICRLVDLTAELGTPPTFEGRHLYAVKISDNVATDEDEPAFLQVAAHHCREIVTPVIGLLAIEQLTSQYGTDPAVTAVVDEYEIWIAPVWNPDGYEHVFNVDNLWRKNRRVFGPDVGVDLNRNYSQGWFNGCSGSTTPSSITYKGPAPSSEAETMTLEAFTERERFAKVLDHHSSGREVLHGYACWTHPFDAYLQSEAQILSNQAGYGSIRAPSADGEHYEWQLGPRGAYAFLMETHTTFQPSFASAIAEAQQVWPATLWMLERAIPLQGHVT